MRSLLFVVLAVLIALAAPPRAAHAEAKPAARDFAPGLQIPDATRPGPDFDVDRATGATLSEAFHFPLGLARPAEPAEITAAIERDRGGWLMRLKASSVARYVNITDANFRASDNWFHLSPLEEKVVRLAPRTLDSLNAVPLGAVNALNMRAPVAFRSPPVECRVAS